ncbi:WD repeat-containing protein 53-like isoform X1 [Acipenser ruthenus]|uniref:WD repeat-containing protein 53-like isoform X1 n=2 Tax=Acipenser ruthenus TaxID=7906 RepID=UPI002740F754|nr:WD repeat-containing protein 53-like isoform X1 [Acipenser ruthenus]
MAWKWCDGHSLPVLCVGAGTDGLLASGAEGGELTVWSDEGTPIGQLKLDGGDDVTCATFSLSSPNKLYISHGEAVSILDARALKKPVDLFRVSEDEINCLSVNETDSLIAAADDSGSIKILDLSSRKVIRSLRKHTNICSSVAFRPQRPQCLVSCGLDMQVMLWNLQKARPLWVQNLQELGEEEEVQQSAGQLFNPPLAHAITVAACGNTFACGSEDGKIHMFKVVGTRFERQVGFKGHSQGVSQVHFVNFLSHPHWLVSGGNDGKVLLWDASTGSMTESKGQAKGGHRRKAKSVKGASKEGADHNTELEVKAFSPKLCINHEEKVNWICPAQLKGEGRIIVADQSSSLSVYPITGL